MATPSAVSDRHWQRITDRAAISGETAPWASAPDPEVSARLGRLLERIPAYLAATLHATQIEGLSQSQYARLVGRRQPAICNRVRAAQERIRWVVEHLPDLTPSEVRVALEDRGYDPRHAAIVGGYWREHRATRVRVPGEPRPVPQATVWGVLWGTGRGVGVVEHADPLLREIGAGLRAIRDMPGRRLWGKEPRG